MKKPHTFLALPAVFGAIFLASPFLANGQNVGIGTTNPLEKLHVDGNIRANNLAGVGVRPLFVDALGTITATSSGTPNPGIWWGTTGNSSTVPATHFLGTTDNQRLNIRTNNARRAWIDGNGRMVIGASDASEAYSLRVNATGAVNGENIDATTINGIMAQTGAGAGIGVYGQKTEWGNGAAIVGANTKTGIVGDNLNAIGVHGQTYALFNGFSNVAAGVFGEELSSSSGSGGGGTFGVYGQANNSASIGVGGRAYGATGKGVFGQAFGADAEGVFGQNFGGIRGRGVYGQAFQGANGVGVLGQAWEGINGIGVNGQSNAGFAGTEGDNGIGVLGEATNTEGGTTWGVKGTALSGGGIGVEGTANGGNGQGVKGTGGLWGVYGTTANTTGGIAVEGYHPSNTIGIGVKGTAGSIGVQGIAECVTNLGVPALGTAGTGVFGQSFGRSGIGVRGIANNNNTDAGSAPIGVQGQAASSLGFGGNFQNSNTAGIGLFARGGTALRARSNNATSGIGVIGIGNNGSGAVIPTGGAGGAFTGLNTGSHNVATVTGAGTSVGVFGESRSDAGRGIEGRATGSSGVGVYGSSQSFAGVQGDAVTAGSYGLVGTQSGGQAALLTIGLSQLLGSVSITGDLTVSGTVTSGPPKPFTIDHPLDPARKLLRHYSIESDEVINLYRGKTNLNQNGEATIQLPDYFTAINKNFTYNLTCIGSNEPIFIKQEIEKGSFVIAGGKPGLKVCWTVMAERNDLIMQENPDYRAVVIEKGDKAGSYVSPKLYKSDRHYWNNGEKLPKSVVVPAQSPAKPLSRPTNLVQD